MRLRSLLSFVFIAFVAGSSMLSSCKDSSTNPGSTDTTKTNTPLDTFLLMTTSTPATVTVDRGATVPFDFTVTRSGKNVDSAQINFTDPIIQGGQQIGPSVNGALGFVETIPGNLAAGSYRFVFRARYFAHDLKVKPDFIYSDSIVRTIVVTGRLRDSMQLAAHAKGPDAISVSWTRLFGDTGIDTVIATANGVVAATELASGSASDITGLQSGVVYSISVHSAVAISEAIQWATALHFGPVRIYETADNTAGHYSGLILATGQVIDVSANSPIGANADVVLASDPQASTGLSLVSASVTTLSGIIGGRTTLFSDFPVFSQGLDYTNYRKDFSHKFDSAFNAIELPAASEPMTFQLKTADDHYAQMEVMVQPNNTLIGTDADGQYFLDILISYQPVANAPYASRPRPVTTELKRSRRF